MTRVASFLCLLVVTAGCGDDVRSGDPGAGGAGDGGSGATGAQSNGGAGAEASGGAGGTGPECHLFDNDVSAGAVTVRVHNQRATSIFTTEACTNAFGIRADGEELLSSPPPLSWTCEQAQEALEAPCCDCLDSTPLEIAAGGTWETTWGGLLWMKRAMNDACYKSGVTWDCLQGELPDTSTLEVVVHLWNNADCSSDVDCSYEGPFEGVAEFSYPTDTLVEVFVE